MRTTSDPMTRYGIVKFGSPRARPRVTGIYAGAGGWHRPPRRIRLTKATAEQLRDHGITMVRVRWRLRNYEIILRRDLGG